MPDRPRAAKATNGTEGDRLMLAEAGTGAFLPSRPRACHGTGVSRPRCLGQVVPLSFSGGAG
jgi:hypothetical protein